MKYCFTTSFLYGTGADDAALARRFAAFFRTCGFQQAVLQPRSRKLAPTEEHLAELLVPTDGYLDSHIDWSVKREGKSITGKLALTRIRPGFGSFTSFLDLKFALSAGYRGGPFASADEVRDAAVALMTIGPSPIGVIEVDDEPHETRSAKFERFREIDTLRMPVSIEWITVLHRAVVADLGASLRHAERVPGVRVGEAGEYGWIVLCPEPFRYADARAVAAQEQVHRELRLVEAQERFRRTPPRGSS
jgi:hypothetical protein